VQVKQINENLFLDTRNANEITIGVNEITINIKICSIEKNEMA